MIKSNLQNCVVQSFLKLNPVHQLRNPVMFSVYIGSLMTTGLFIQSLMSEGETSSNFILAVTVWLWFTLLFSNFAEAMAEARGKAQAASLRKARFETEAKKLASADRNAKISLVRSADLRVGDY